MSGIGSGYDLEASTFSPEGQIYQVEYAQKAVDNCGTVIAIAGKNGVVTAVDKLVVSKLVVQDSSPRVSHVNDNIGYTCAGNYSDAQSLLDCAQEEAIDYLKQFKTPIPTKKLAQNLAEYMHYFTLGSSRPYGCAAFLTSYENDTPSIRLVEPSGQCYAYKAWAIGKNRQAAKTEIEKLNLANLDMDQLVKEAVRILLIVRDETENKNQCIEVGWVGESTNDKFEVLKKEVIAVAEQQGKSLIVGQAKL